MKKIQNVSGENYAFIIIILLLLTFILILVSIFYSFNIELFCDNVKSIKVYEGYKYFDGVDLDTGRFYKIRKICVD